MVTQQEITGRWNEIKGKLLEKWGQLSSDDFQQFNGNVDQLVGRIQQRTGESREAISKYIQSLTSDGQLSLEAISSHIGDATNAALNQFNETSDQLSAAAQEKYEEAEELVRSRPMESIAVCFGVGLITGVIVGLAIRGK